MGNNISVPRALEGLATSHQEVESGALPLSLEDCAAGFDQQRIPEWKA